MTERSERSLLGYDLPAGGAPQLAFDADEGRLLSGRALAAIVEGARGTAALGAGLREARHATDCELHESGIHIADLQGCVYTKTKGV